MARMVSVGGARSRVAPAAPVRARGIVSARLALLLVATTLWISAPTQGGRVAATSAVRVHLPLVARGQAAPPPDINEEYVTLLIEGDPETRPAAEHPDLNLAVRGYKPVGAHPGLVDYDGHTDLAAPQLVGLLGRAPVIRGTYRVYDWDWVHMTRAGPIRQFPVTFITLAAERNALVRVPDSGRTIGNGNYYEVLVLYADTNRITLKYTREDNVIKGYTLHLEHVRVAPELLDLYREANRAGRRRLPALRAGQALGWVPGDAIGVAIRDVGSFMDPRSRKDWWQGF